MTSSPGPGRDSGSMVTQVNVSLRKSAGQAGQSAEKALYRGEDFTKHVGEIKALAVSRQK